jgi:hypothetical protein
MADYLDRLVIQTVGEAEVRRLSAAIAAEKDLLVQLDARLKAAGVSAQQAKVATDVYAASIANLNVQLRQAQAAAAGGGGFMGGHGAVTMNQMASAAEDLQYGIKAVGNNIVYMTSMLGPWGGAVGLGVVGAIQLYEHWDSIAKLFGQGHTETEAERMERLAKATNRTAAETAELNKHKREEAAFEAAMPPTKAEAESSKAAVDVVRERGGPIDLARRLAAARAEAEGPETGLDDADAKKLAELRRFMEAAKAAGRPYGYVQPQIDELLAKGRATLGTRAESDIKKALADPAALERLIGELESRPGSINKDLIKELKSTLPGETGSPETKRKLEEQYDKDFVKLGKENAAKSAAFAKQYESDFSAMAHKEGAANLARQKQVEDEYEKGRVKATEEWHKRMETPESRAAFDEEAKSVYKQQIKEGTDYARKRNLGLDERVQRDLMEGLDPAKLTAMLAKKFEGQGLSKARAEGTAKDIVDKNAGDLREKIAEASLNPYRRPSQNLDIGSYVDAAQTAGAETNKKLDELIKIAGEQVRATTAAGRAPMVLR